MNRVDVSKIYFYAVSITGILGLFFAFGLYTAAKKTVIYNTLLSIKHSVEESLNLVSEETSTLAKAHPVHFLQPARYEGSGVTVNDFADSANEFVFLSGFFDNGNELRLIRRNGTVISRWPAKFSEIFPNPNHLSKPPKTDWNIDIHGALALSDGSVVFNFEYSGVVKLDRCANVVWTLARAAHHSIELSQDGGFWVPGRRFHSEESDSPFPPFQTPFKEDTIMKVSEDGSVLIELSVPKLFYDNGLEALLTSTGKKSMAGSPESEIVHLNKIAELKSDIADDFPMFESGDLALSLRGYNMILVVDPDTRKIKWWRIGPWLRQHDPEFLPGGKIIVFNNNIYRTAFEKGTTISGFSVPRISNILEFDFLSGNHRLIYGGVGGQEILSILRGKHEPTVKGGLLITEFEGGRVFEVDATSRIIWEYINRYDSDEVAEITEARVYPVDYFKVPEWSCENRKK